MKNLNNNKITVIHCILFYAFRYALGRKTYAVDDVVSAILENISNIPDNDIRVMNKELLEAFQNNRTGGEYHSDRWREVYKALNEERIKRKIF